MKEEHRRKLGEEKICGNKMEEKKVRERQGGGRRRKIKMRDGRVLDHTGVTFGRSSKNCAYSLRLGSPEAF